ncbi:MAG TPA: N-acetylmuramidase family protein [Sphingomonas sp.]|nr:N-acetylmuramidase family protein [Sphingomonas sp.]
MDIATLQRRMVALGYPLAVDGRYGPITRAAVLAALTDPPDTAINAADVRGLAEQWDVDVAALWAVRDVEASGAGFADGRPKLLFEPHRFSKATGHRFDKSHPTISYRTWDRSRYPAGQRARYEQLLDAIALDVDAAFASASYGAFQILGENWQACGEDSPLDFALTEARGELGQLRHFTRFCASNGLVPALRRKDWAAFAKGYNGTAYRANRYDERLAAAYRARGGR